MKIIPNYIKKKKTAKLTPTVAYFLQQSHSYSNKVILPNSATAYRPIGAIFIQTTTDLKQQSDPGARSLARVKVRKAKFLFGI